MGCCDDTNIFNRYNQGKKYQNDTLTIGENIAKSIISAGERFALSAAKDIRQELVVYCIFICTPMQEEKARPP